MILIADSGSTKTDWILMDEDKNQTGYSTIGYNPYFTDSDGIYNSLTLKLTPQLDAAAVKTVFFYGAGCSTPEKEIVVYNALSKCFPNSELSIKHDLLGAARALLGNKKGFAAIIGTGSNTGIYDGNTIDHSIDSLGYLLGDEGSGCYIGKKIVKDFLRDTLPQDLLTAFQQTYPYSPADIYDCIYNQPLPNRFLAGFCRFADENREHIYIRKLVKESFNDFFTNLVSKYDDYKSYTFNSVGSVGHIFRDVLEEVATFHCMETGRIICSPIRSLADYHLNQNIT